MFILSIFYQQLYKELKDVVGLEVERLYRESSL